jgi:hypothetical protein
VLHYGPKIWIFVKKNYEEMEQTFISKVTAILEDPQEVSRNLAR